MANIIIGKKDREAIIKFLEDEYKQPATASARQAAEGARSAAASVLRQKTSSKKSPSRPIQTGKQR